VGIRVLVGGDCHAGILDSLDPIGMGLPRPLPSRSESWQRWMH